MILLDQLFSKKLGKPFIKMPPDDALPMLSATEVVIYFYLEIYRKPYYLKNLNGIMLNLI